MNRRTILGGVIAVAALALLFGVEAANALHAVALGAAVGCIAGDHIVAAIGEIREWRDERFRGADL